MLDEVEKASEEIEYTLLEVLENFSISIPQYGTVTCPEEMRPIVFLTSNRYRDLSQALNVAATIFTLSKRQPKS